MNPDGHDARAIAPPEPDDPAAYSAEESERLIRFFQILDQWDRNQAGQVSRVDRPRVASSEPAGTIGPKPVPIVQE
jgi:hypothetical protein